MNTPQVRLSSGGKGIKKLGGGRAGIKFAISAIVCASLIVSPNGISVREGLWKIVLLLIPLRESEAVMTSTPSEIFLATTLFWTNPSALSTHHVVKEKSR